MKEEIFTWTDEKVIAMQKYWFNEQCHVGFIEAMNLFKEKHSEGYFGKTTEDKYPEGILAFKYVNAKNTWNVVTYNNDIDYQDWVRVYVNSPIYQIAQVKNSSGEVLTVGDRTNFGIISAFEIKNNAIYIYAGCFHLSIGVVHPYPPPIKTEDGFEIKDGEFYTCVHKKDFTINVMRYLKYADNKKDYFDVHYFFHDKSNAEVYIELNKLRFSKQDIEAALPAISDCIGLGGTVENAKRNFKSRLGI